MNSIILIFNLIFNYVIEIKKIANLFVVVLLVSLKIFLISIFYNF